MNDSHAAASKPGFGLRTLLAGPGRIWLLALVSGAVATTVSTGWVAHLDRPNLDLSIPWPLLAVMFGLAEAFVVHLPVRRGDAHSFSLNEVPLVLGLFFTGPAGLILAQLTGAAVTLVFYRKQQPIKIAFNLGHLCLEAALAAAAFTAVLSTHDPAGPAGWIAALMGSMLAATLAAAFVQVAISLSQGRFSLRRAASNISLAMIVAACNTSLALAAVNMLARDPRSVWLMAAPVIVVFFAYRGYTRQRQKHEGLEFLYESTRMLHRSPNVDQALTSLLEQARTMFRAELATITFFATGDEAPMRAELGPDNHVQGLTPVTLDPREGVWARVAAEAQAVLLARPIRSERLRAYFDSRGIRDAMVAPIVGEQGVVGTMLVGNRLGDVGSFDEEDLRLFETLANHASVSLQKVRLVSRLEDALARMTEMNRLKDDFVATVSHELRTPLTSIQGFVQTMLRPDTTFDPAEQREFLEIVERQSRRLRGLIEDLLVVARIETHELRPTPVLLSVQALTRRVVDDLAGRSRGQVVEFQFDEPLPLVNTDQEMVYRILSNLIDNAYKYSPEGSTIVVAARAEGAGARISVSDQGEGIPDELRERIFERFYQVDQSHTRTVGGTGLGLYICRRLAEALRGRLWLERSDEEGSLFTLWVPDLSTELPAADGNGHVALSAPPTTQRL